jgi:uncharacterized membrane-anchored protein
MENDKKAARAVAHKALEIADTLHTAAQHVLRSLRRGNDDWQDVMQSMQGFVEPYMNAPTVSDDAEDARTEEA